MSLSRNRIRAVVLGAAALLALGAYVGLAYMIDPAVMDSGGGHAASTNYKVDCSIGGPVIASGAASGQTAESANYTCEVGGISVIEPAEPDEVTFPAVIPAGDAGCGGDPRAGAPALVLPLAVLLLARRRLVPRPRPSGPAGKG